MEDQGVSGHGQNDPAARDQDEVNARVAMSFTSFYRFPPFYLDCLYCIITHPILEQMARYTFGSSGPFNRVWHVGAIEFADSMICTAKYVCTEDNVQRIMLQWSVCGLSYYPELQCLLKRDSDPLAEDDVMISGEMNTQPPVPPPDSCLITAQLEATNLTCAEYRSIASLMSSLLSLPTGALVYVGHTLSPLTLHWHCSAAQKEECNPVYSISLLTEMVQKGIRKIRIGDKLESEFPQRNVSYVL